MFDIVSQCITHNNDWLIEGARSNRYVTVYWAATTDREVSTFWSNVMHMQYGHVCEWATRINIDAVNIDFGPASNVASPSGEIDDDDDGSDGDESSS